MSRASRLEIRRTSTIRVGRRITEKIVFLDMYDAYNSDEAKQKKLLVKRMAK